jgi:hypothetical protein
MVDALTRSERLFFVFITYVAVILVFAVIYLNIYRTRPTSFAFNKDILKTERRLLRVIRERDFEKRQANLEITRARLESELTVFRYCLGELEKDDPMVPFERDLQQDGIWITRKYRVFVRLEYEESQPDPGQAHGESIPYTRLVVEEKNGQTVANVTRDDHPERFPADRATFANVMGLFIGDHEASLNRLKQMKADARDSQDVWSFWDFLYFSVVTQTTVGYGDILPNSTCVRVCVILQILIGLVLIAFALNLI